LGGGKGEGAQKVLTLENIENLSDGDFNAWNRELK